MYPSGTIGYNLENVFEMGTLHIEYGGNVYLQGEKAILTVTEKFIIEGSLYVTRSAEIRAVTLDIKIGGCINGTGRGYEVGETPEGFLAANNAKNKMVGGTHAGRGVRKNQIRPFLSSLDDVSPIKESEYDLYREIYPNMSAPVNNIEYNENPQQNTAPETSLL